MTQQRIYIDDVIGLGTLGAGLVLKTATKVDATRENGIRIQKLMAAMTFAGKTATEGPIIVGLCSTDLSTTEIAEAIDADPQKPDDTPASEQVMRQVMPIWVIGTNDTASLAGPYRYEEIPYPWKEVAEGDGLTWFAMNEDGSALTTGMTIEIQGFLVGEWLND